MVPNGWTVKTLNDVSRITRLAGAEYSDVWETNSNGEIIALRGFNIGNNEVNLRDVERITQDMSLKLSRSKLYKKDIVFPCVGSIGKAYLVQEDNKFHINQNIAKLTPSDTVEPLFLTYCLLSKACVNQILKFNTSSSQPNVLVGNLRKFQFAFPQDRKEQRKIAQILSTWDKAIATTEKLIDTSKQQKKALMQQLLTGKKRLVDPETGKAFEGEWEEVRLSALSIKGKGNFTDGDWIESPYIADSGCRLIQTGNIGVGCFKNKAKKYISEASFVKLKCKEVKVNDLLICRLAEPAGRACVVPDIGERKMLTSVDVTIMRVDKTKSSPEYLSYFFSLDHTLYTVTTLCGGSTRSRISRTNLGRMKIFLPALNEQQKIAVVLSAADKEIELLEAKLAHLKQEKKALMQQLLTGKRRVQVAETEVA